MNSQLAFNSTKDYKERSNVCQFLGFLCGKPVYSKQWVTYNPFILKDLDAGGLNNTPLERYRDDMVGRMDPLR